MAGKISGPGSQQGMPAPNQGAQDPKQTGTIMPGVSVK